MKNFSIKVEGLSKKYLISHKKRESYVSMRDIIVEKAKSAVNLPYNRFSKNKNIIDDKQEIFWALNDINFEIEKGESIGIIGRNGAGKSTLLKLLSRITEPSSGKISINGRMASLLEVGTGFHPELTGRENIYLNGAILGMSRNEVKSKFDEIVEFSEVENFLDTPVKRFSSGMYVRLAFAIAAHLEAEILIVDEVLAVGDAEFQKKCLGKMNEVSKSEGKTILFVSHNILATKQICKKGILLDRGRIKAAGEINDVVDKYISRTQIDNKFSQFEIKELGLKITNITLNKIFNGIVEPFKPLIIEVEILADREISKIGIQVMISNDDVNGMLFASNTKTTNNIDVKLKMGYNKITCLIEKFNLCSGKYTLGFAIDLPFVTFYYHNLDLFSFEVEEVISAPRLISTSSASGRVYLENKWFSE